MPMINNSDALFYCEKTALISVNIVNLIVKKMRTLRINNYTTILVPDHKCTEEYRQQFLEKMNSTEAYNYVKPKALADIDSDELIRLHVVEKKTLKALSKKYGVSNTTLSNKLKELGVKANTCAKCEDLTESELRRMYIDEKMSTAKIGKLYNTSQGPILRLLRKYGIKVKSKGQS